MTASFPDVICKNIDLLADAPHRSQGSQAYVDQYLEMLWSFSERTQGRSGLAERPKGEREVMAKLERYLPTHVRHQLRVSVTKRNSQSKFTTGGLPKKKSPQPITLRNFEKPEGPTEP